MRVLVATYYDKNQADIAVDEFVSTLKDNEYIEQLEIIPIGQRWRVGIMIDKKQMEFDFDGC